MPGSDSRASALPFTTRTAANIIRRLPVQVRRVRVWRDKLYEALGAGGWDENDAVDAVWPSGVQAPIRGRISGFKMLLDLSDWAQRRTYFTGRYYQEDLEDLLSKLLRAGDNFVDVGANIGLVTLHAAQRVGSSGTVWAFEPNPEVYERLLRHVEVNGLDRRRVLNKGLGVEAGSLTMSIYGRHTGKASLLSHAAPSSKTVSVEVCRGDKALVQLDAQKPTVIKIDVEGYEVSVLDGLDGVLDGNVAIVVEVSKTWLQLAGTSAAHLHHLLASHGLVPYSFEVIEKRVGRSLVVSRLDRPLELDQYDCLFIRPGSIFEERLGGSLIEA